MALLFQDQAHAASEFKRVQTMVSHGALADRTARWLALLDLGMPTSPREVALHQVLSQEVFHDLTGSLDASARETPAPALMQKIKDQERRIADLTRQLEMLKEIDRGRYSSPR
jgi:hypothetical protein